MPHIHEKIDFTVEVFIVYKNTVLLRKHDKYNIWLSVGGHIELDEDPNHAAIREVKEEVGLDIELYNPFHYEMEQSSTYHELIPPFFLNRHTIHEAHQHITLTYFAKAPTNEIHQITAEEKSNELRWFTEEDLKQKKDLSQHVRMYAQKALEELQEA